MTNHRSVSGVLLLVIALAGCSGGGAGDPSTAGSVTASAPSAIPSGTRAAGSTAPTTSPPVAVSPATTIAPTTPPTTAPTIAPTTPPTQAPSESASTPTASARPALTRATWTRLRPEVGPEPREDHTWTVDEAGERAYLFGGRAGGTVHGDLWVYDLAADAWAQIDAPGGPEPRFGHEAVWVPGFGLVLFAGQAGPRFFSDLWRFDPDAATWSRLPAGGDVPVPRYGSCAAVGPDGRLWISHGFTEDGVRFSDTRAYDFAAGTWSDETPAEGRRPVERCLHGCWFDDAGALVLYAGQTTGVTALGDLWRLADPGTSGGSWERIEGELPAARNLYARAAAFGLELVFGGRGIDGYVGDLWAFDLAIVGPPRPLDTIGDAPPARSGAELIADPVRGRLLLFGGKHDGGTFQDLWQAVLE